jgi:hypothetical protein
MHGKTDSDGRFLFEGVGPGTVEVHTSLGLRSLNLLADTELDLDFQIRSLTGIVVDADSGAAIAGARVMLISSPLEFTRDGITGGDGRFHFKSVPDAPLQALVHKEGYASSGLPLAPEELAGQEVEIRLQAGEQLIVRAIPAAGKLPSGRTIAAVFSATGALQAFSQAVPDTEGLLRFSGLPSGTQRMVFAPEHYAIVQLTVTIPGGPYPMVLEPETSMVLRIPPIAGAPALVSCRLLQNGEPFFHPALLLGWEGYASDTGFVEVPIGGLPSGSWTVEVTTADGRVLRGQATTSPGQPAVAVLE